MSTFGHEDFDTLGKIIEAFKAIAALDKVYQLARTGLEKAEKLISAKLVRKRKLLLIGGGEIGVEIATSAIDTKRWSARAVIDESVAPIVYLPFLVAESPSRFSNDDFEIKGLRDDPHMFFQYRYLPNLHGSEAIKDLKELIVKMEPDVVLLEDMFMRREEWNGLCSLILGDPTLGRKPMFLPSPTKTTEHLTGEQNRYSDLFLSKIHMKSFLANIGLGANVLNRLWNENCGSFVLDMTELRKDLPCRAGEEYEKIASALAKYKKIILKPETTSSGHGQFVLSSMDQLTPDFLDRQIGFAKDYRVPNDKYLVERYLANKQETCIIIAETNEGNLGLYGFNYVKYDMEEFSKFGLEGQTRLLYSEARRKIEQPLLRHIPELANEIWKNLSVPFLYVEFLIDLDLSEPNPGHGIYINEISYRPDDAGFVTHMSHKKNQFELFVEGLETRLEGEERHGKPRYIEPEDDCTCKTLILCEPFDFNDVQLRYTTNSGRTQDHFRFQFFVKALGQEVYRRIIGYQWHHKDQEEVDGGRHILTMHKSDLGLSGESLKQLIDFLDTAKARR